MPHGGPHYKIVGTDTEYVGKVIMIAGEPFSTTGQTLEGNSQRLELMDGSTSMNQTQNNTNPVTRTFVSRVMYYRQDGSEVPVGSDLHQHQDGTIMLGHDPENMGAIVTRNRPTSSTRNATQTINQTRRTRTQTPRTRTSTGGMGGGRRSSGGGGGGY